MIIAKEYNFIHILSFILLCLILWALPIVTMAETDTDSFYGGQSLNSIVDGEKMTLTLPGGAKVAMENQETAYTVPDHTQSTRLAVATDNTISEPIVYTPFGDNQATGETSLTESYTGMTFEPETATYDYHARSYDPTVARFGSPDAIRESVSPYSYTENNPINFIDPDGLGRWSLFLFSKFDTSIESSPGYAGLNKTVIKQTEKIFNLGLPVLVAPLENTTVRLPLPKQAGRFAKIKHITISAHGTDFGRRIELAGEPYKPRIMSGEEFAEHLFGILSIRNPKSIKTVKTMTVASCCLGLERRYRQHWTPFAEAFVAKAKTYFPKLESVITTPYDFRVISHNDEHTGVGLLSPTEIGITISKLDDIDTVLKSRKELVMPVDAEQYYSGKIPKHLFQKPDHSIVRLGIEENQFHGRFHVTTYQYKRTPEEIDGFIKSGDFERPIFNREMVVR